MTPLIARQWTEEVSDGERPAFALMCFTTDDRLRYQAWVDDMLRYIRQANVILDYYESEIRERR